MRRLGREGTSFAATTKTSGLYILALRLPALAFKNPDNVGHELGAKKKMGREGREGHGA